MTMIDPKAILKKVTPTPQVETGLTNDEKKVKITALFTEIMNTLGLDLTDDSLRETPHRVAKMYVDEIFYGLEVEKFPKITIVENKFDYDHAVIEVNIVTNSHCEHHFVPIIGKTHIAYIPKNKVLGLSKLNRIVDYFAKRPQIQERLTLQIHQALVNILETDDVAVVTDAMHACVKTRGIKDVTSMTRTSKLSGAFKQDTCHRAEFLNTIPRAQEVIY
ncbi:GTP cyclohydrolase I FolE [Bacteriovorax sp. PP10]|uniref:GTP cyclohydrolase 1 n=1 Tax=Bacteriovorax antarcticus TaxID=3088717 RepID=A0ABU5VS31_9BACT|nr:GTP cyclohydrolase I FolE [Bacteriovorax sp. PP10]MEA9355873.1 GTP cyclohydrolase I FolE [Bacteriovorax sp. PP10]